MYSNQVLRLVILLAAAVLATPCHSAGSPIPPSPTPASFFGYVFAQTCIKFVGSPERLGTEMAARRAVELEPDKARTFLRGGGRAWLIPNPVGELILSMNNAGGCTLHARRASATDVDQLFVDLMSSATPPYASAKLRDTRSEANGALAPVHMIAYAWSRATSRSRAIFTLSTTSDPGAPLQAIASSAIVEE